MKLYEREIRETQTPFVITTNSGDRIRVRSIEHIFLPPLEDEDGNPLEDESRSDFFEVWSNGRTKRRIAFASINILEGFE